VISCECADLELPKANLWYTLSTRPWTSPSTAYTPWYVASPDARKHALKSCLNRSVAWPILAVSGPVAAATSLLAIPFVAVAAGGTALASLTAFGSAAATGVASAGTAVTSGAASAAGLAARAAALPGGSKVKGKLVDAAKQNMGARGEVIIPKVVKYFAKGTAKAAVGGALKEGDEEHGPDRKGRGKGKKLDEVDVTGFELEKVLKCDTGKHKVDKVRSRRLSLSVSVKTDFPPIAGFDGSIRPTEHEDALQDLGQPRLTHRRRVRCILAAPDLLELNPTSLADPNSRNAARINTLFSTHSSSSTSSTSRLRYREFLSILPPLC
jgi:hypothetical protein